MSDVKGSRDPLRLVRIWHRVGRHLSGSPTTMALVALVFASMALASERPFAPVLLAGGSADDGGPAARGVGGPRGARLRAGRAALRGGPRPGPDLRD